MSRFLTRFLVLTLVTVAVAATWWYASRPQPVAIRVQALGRGLVEQRVANTRAGTVKACRRARLSPSVGGQIASLLVSEGQRVKRGTLLLELWNRDLAAQVDLAQRQYEARESQARATCLETENAKREAARQVKLRSRGVASEETVDKATTLAQSRQADCAAARTTIRVDRARIGLARANLEKTRLKAPFDGVVAEITGELNEYVTPSPPGIPTPPAIDFIDDSCFYVTAPIDEVDAPDIRVGASARITLDAFGERNFPGRVRRIAPYVLDLEKQARTVEVEVAFDDPEDLKALLAGYSADVEIIVKRREQVLRVPTEAVMENDEVYLFRPRPGIVEKRQITAGLSNWDWTEVRGGLQSGDQVVVSLEQEGLADGVPATLAQDTDR